MGIARRWLPGLLGCLLLALLTGVTGACFCDPQDPAGFVYACNETIDCPEGASCRLCTEGQLRNMFVCFPFPPGNGLCTAVSPATEDGAAFLCGDGMLDPDEECDDGNVQDGDGCDRWCFLE